MTATATKTSSKTRRKAKRRPVSRARRNGTSKARMIRALAKRQGRKVRPVDIVDELAAKGITVSCSQVRAALKTARAGKAGRGRTSKSGVARNGFALREKAQAFFVEELSRLKKLASQLRSTDGFKKTVATLERRLERLFRFRTQKPSRRRHA